MTAECGTKAGYQRHRRRKEEPCADCRTANAAYLREWRQRPDAAVSTRICNRARARAAQALVKLHPDEYRRLLKAERRKLLKESS